MNQINHIILDTGELTVSAPDEFSQKTIDDMTAWLKHALESTGYVPLPAPLSNYNALVDRGDDGLLCSLYGPPAIVPQALQSAAEEVPDEGVRLLIFGVALEKGSRLWNFLMQGFYVGDRIIPMPAEPWVSVLPYQMYPFAPDPGQLIRFQKCVARSLIEISRDEDNAET